MRHLRLVSLFVLLAACGSATPTPKPVAVPSPGARTISIVGTNDLHGAIDRLPMLAGYFNILRAARAADGGAMVAIDAGDMFQGTLGSNLDEGATVIKAYGAMGYDAAAIGNHEFDFGPVGPAVTAQTVDDDPRGALKHQAAAAGFPLLTANVLDAASGQRISWPNMPASTTVEAAGLKIGVIGVTTESTPFTTMAANFTGLAMQEPARSIIAESKRLRAAGVQLIVVAAHIGSKCTDLHDPADLSSCDQTEELFQVARVLPPGLVNVIVAGHTHAAMAHRIGDIAVIESYANGRAFGRVDVRVNATGTVTGVTILQPQDVCPVDAEGNLAPVEQCQGQMYEGLAVTPDPAITAIVEPALANARTTGDEELGAVATGAITRSYDHESALGNFFTDLMLAAQPTAQVALTNGGGLRADIAAGPITFAKLYQANPFDNRFALVSMHGRELRRLITNNLSRDNAIYSWGGIAVIASCKGDSMAVDIRIGGKLVTDEQNITLVTSDFLAASADGVIGRLKLPAGSVTVTDTIIRNSMADVLRMGGNFDPSKLYSKQSPRLAYPGERPVQCGEAAPSTTAPEPD